MRCAMGIPDAEKDPSITQTLEALIPYFEPNAFMVIDHWDADRCAIGIAKPDNHRVLVYISTFTQPAFSYAVELEVPSAENDDEAYQVIEQYEKVDFARLVDLIAVHLDLPTTQHRA